MPPRLQIARLRRGALALSIVLLGVLLLGAYRMFERGPGFGEDGLTPLTFTCDDGRCDTALGESPDTCRRDCPEPDPRVTGFYTDLTRCPGGAEVHVAKDVEDVRRAVRSLVQRGRRVRPRGQGHSTSGGFCSDGGVVVLEGLTAIGELERWHDMDTVVIEPGVTFERLGEFLHARGRSFGPHATGWGGIAVVGAMATGSHGSDTRRPSTISEQLVAVELVDPRGELVRYDRFETPPNTWRALVAHDGALGLVVRARIQVEPDRRLRLDYRELPLDAFKTAAGLDAAIGRCDYVFLNLMLASDRAHVACGAVTDAPVTDERVTNFLFAPPARPVELSLVRTVLQLTTTSKTMARAVEGQILAGYRRSIAIEPGAPGEPMVSVGSEAVGWNHRIVNLPRFPYPVPYFSQMDYEVSVRAADLPAVVQLVDEIYDHAGRNLPHTGLIVRFDRATDHALLAGNSLRPGVAPGDMLAHVELPTFIPFGYRDEALEAYLRPGEESVRQILTRFPSARPHIGKNRASVFAHFAALGRDRDQLARFQAVVDELDPYGVFANEHLRRMGLRWPREGQGFAAHDRETSPTRAP